MPTSFEKEPILKTKEHAMVCRQTIGGADETFGSKGKFLLLFSSNASIIMSGDSVDVKTRHLGWSILSKK